MNDIQNRLFGDSISPYQSSSASDYNKRVMKSMIKYSPLSSIMFVTLVVMFLVCLITDIVHSRRFSINIQSSTLIFYGANTNYYEDFQVWRFVTAMFLHAGLFHLLMNSMSFLLYLMPVQAKLNNHYIYAFALFFGGIMGNMLSICIKNYERRTLVAVGASTSICSIIGFNLMFKFLRVDGQPLRIRRIVITLVWIFLISVMPNVDFFGHFGSLFAGAMIASVFLTPSRNYFSSQQIKTIKYAGIISLVVYFVSLVALLMIV